MGVGQAQPEEVTATALETLGLDAASGSLLSAEAISASIRRAASVLCPTTRGALARVVGEAVELLPGFVDEQRNEILELVDALIANGDLLELPSDATAESRRQIYLGPPGFVPRGTSAILVGVRPDGAPLLGGDLNNRIAYDRHVRTIQQIDDECLEDRLAEEGLVRIAADRWLLPRRAMPPGDVAGAFKSRLAARVPTGDLDGIRIIDPTTDVSYYRGRWRSPRAEDAGTFVARRPQAYGADLWCFANLSAGAVTRVLDLPALDVLAPASDEAWLLQTALDAEAGTPQRFRLRAGDRRDVTLFDLFGPIPRWAQRRLDAVGVPTTRGRGALLSYAIPAAEAQTEAAWLREMLWLVADDTRTSN
jgi:hypothetical protein